MNQHSFYLVHSLNNTGDIQADPVRKTKVKQCFVFKAEKASLPGFCDFFYTLGK